MRETGRAVSPTYPDQKLLTHAPGLVPRFLEHKGRNTRLKNWQFIQTIDAIQKLFILINVLCGQIKGTQFFWKNRGWEFHRLCSICAMTSAKDMFSRLPNNLCVLSLLRLMRGELMPHRNRAVRRGDVKTSACSCFSVLIACRISSLFAGV